MMKILKLITFVMIHINMIVPYVTFHPSIVQPSKNLKPFYTNWLLMKIFEFNVYLKGDEKY